MILSVRWVAAARRSSYTFGTPRTDWGLTADQFSRSGAASGFADGDWTPRCLPNGSAFHALSASVPHLRRPCFSTGSDSPFRSFLAAADPWYTVRPLFRFRAAQATRRPGRLPGRGVLLRGRASAQVRSSRVPIIQQYEEAQTVRRLSK